jgi:hypothetical protein
MGYVLITADFPEVSSAQRDLIYKCLEQKNIVKIREFERDISTVWQAYYPNLVEADDIKNTISLFEACSSPFCKPKLVMEWGPNKPVYHNLV